MQGTTPRPRGAGRLGRGIAIASALSVAIAGSAASVAAQDDDRARAHVLLFRYQFGDTACGVVVERLFRMLEVSVETLKRRAGRLGRRLRERGVPVHGQTTRAALGGGTTPEETLASYGFAINGGQRLLDALRNVDRTPLTTLRGNLALLSREPGLPANLSLDVVTFRGANYVLRSDHNGYRIPIAGRS